MRKALHCIFAVIWMVMLPVIAFGGVYQDVATLIRDANGLINKGIESKDYDNFIEAKGLLDKAEAKVRYFKDDSKGALAYIAVGYSYARMKNEHTKSYFDAYQWQFFPKTGSEKYEGKENDKETKEKARTVSNDWTSIAEAVRNYENSIRLFQKIPKDKKGDFCVLIAIGYDLVRAQAQVGKGKLSKDALYGKALRYLNRSAKQGTEFKDVTAIVKFYNKMDRWKEESVSGDEEMSYLIDELRSSFISEDGNISIFGRLAFEDGKISIDEKNQKKKE